jgi:hypothetical protein
MAEISAGSIVSVARPTGAPIAHKKTPAISLARIEILVFESHIARPLKQKAATGSLCPVAALSIFSRQP